MKHILLLLLLTCSTVYSQPSSTYHLVSRLPEGPCYSVAVDGNLACVANGSALDVIRVGNQSAPRESVVFCSRASLIVSDLSIHSPTWQMVQGARHRRPDIARQAKIDIIDTHQR